LEKLFWKPLARKKSHIWCISKGHQSKMLLFATRLWMCKKKFSRENTFFDAEEIPYDRHRGFQLPASTGENGSDIVQDLQEILLGIYPQVVPLLAQKSKSGKAWPIKHRISEFRYEGQFLSSKQKA
jgi:hypothetical protein